MNSIGRRFIAVATTATAISAGMLAMPATASAAPAGSCGSGYSKVGSYQVTRAWEGKAGRIDVYYSRATGKNCAITRPNASLAGKAGRIWVCIEPSNPNSSGPRDCDGYGRNYRYHAGPVYTSARGECIDVSGGLNRRPNDNQPFNGGAQRVHCR